MPHLNHRRGETRRSVNREVTCSCSMCGNPRRSLWHPPLTRAEMASELAEREALAELSGGSIDRVPSRKRKPRPWAMQRLDLRPSGEPYDDSWWTCRRYRTKTAALEALRRLTRNGRVTGGARAKYRLMGPGGCIYEVNG